MSLPFESEPTMSDWPAKIKTRDVFVSLWAERTITGSTLRMARRRFFLLSELDERWSVCARFDDFDGIADGVGLLETEVFGEVFFFFLEVVRELL